MRLLHRAASAHHVGFKRALAETQIFNLVSAGTKNCFCPDIFQGSPRDMY